MFKFHANSKLKLISKRKELASKHCQIIISNKLLQSFKLTILAQLIPQKGPASSLFFKHGD